MSSNSTGDKENPIGDKKLENISNYLRLSSLLTITDFRRMARSLKTYIGVPEAAGKSDDRARHEIGGGDVQAEFEDDPQLDTSGNLLDDHNDNGNGVM